VPVIDLIVDETSPAGEFRLSVPVEGHCAASGPGGPDDVALVLHTSGTTSRPKIVPLSHANLCASAGHIRRSVMLTSNDRCLNVMPLFHIHGLMAAVLASLSAGAGVVCTPGFDASRFFGWLEEFAPTWYTAVPTIHQSVLEQARISRDAASRSTLRLIRSSSSALAPQLMSGLEDAFGVPVIESYGMTEAAHQMCSNPLPPHERRAGSVGIAAGPDVAIMDEAGNLLSPGQTGEIVIRGRNVTAGYESNPSANAASFTNGWFRTGDQGQFDMDGYVKLTGRLKEIINRGGEKVSPREIDEVLLDHPAIAQVVTFAVPHRSLGEDIAAAVVLRAGESPSEQEIREFAFEKLADYKVPSRVLFVASIPKGPSGKLQRIGLHQQLSALLQPDYAPPETGTEEIVTEIWAKVLDVERVGRNDNFFALGGDSLIGTRIMTRLRAAFEIELPLETLFRFPTVLDLAAAIEELLLNEMDAANDATADRA
jgi:acyl-CoA synthetase (AMP-forming)/AMP-acid ligase II/acyl carrier protein